MICQGSVGDMSVIRPTIDRLSTGHMSTDTQPSLDQHSTDTWPTLGRDLTETRPTLSRYIDRYVGRQLTDMSTDTSIDTLYKKQDPRNLGCKNIVIFVQQNCILFFLFFRVGTHLSCIICVCHLEYLLFSPLVGFDL